MQNQQNQQNQLIIDYIRQLLCPCHNKPIKFMSYSTNVPLGKKLICSDCAIENGLNNYQEVECIVQEINKDRISQPIRNACQNLVQVFDGYRNTVGSLVNPHIYFLENTQNRQGLMKFQEELKQYHQNNPNQNNTQQLIVKGKNIIFNSIRQLEAFSNDLTTFLTNSQYEQQNLTEIWSKKYTQSEVLLEADFSDQEFFILSGQQLEIYNTQVNSIKLQQQLQLSINEINCMIKAQSKPFLFLGRQDGIVEVFEQLTNGNYISSHKIEAHSSGRQQYGVSCIIINSDSSEIITGGYDSLIKSWRFRNRQWNLISTLTHHKKTINSLSYNSDFNIFGSVSQDQSFSLYKSNSQDYYQNSYTETKENRVNTICFVSPTNFFISLNLEKKIYLYTIQNILDQKYNVQNLYYIELNELNTDISITVQPRYYKQLQLLIFQSNKQTYFIRSENQDKFKLFPINRYIPRNQQQNNSTQPENSLKGIMFRLMEYGQQSIQLFQDGSSYVIRVSKFQ